MNGTCAPMSVSLQIIFDVLDHELSKRFIEILLTAIDAPHGDVLRQLHIFAPAEADGQIAARKALLVFQSPRQWVRL
jgi:hypothetical protein